MGAVSTRCNTQSLIDQKTVMQASDWLRESSPDASRRMKIGDSCVADREEITWEFSLLSRDNETEGVKYESLGRE